jgi:hypothetical protein
VSSKAEICECVHERVECPVKNAFDVVGSLLDILARKVGCKDNGIIAKYLLGVFTYNPAISGLVYLHRIVKSPR